MKKILSAVVFLIAAILAAVETVPLLSPGQKEYIAMPRAERIAFFADQKQRRKMRDYGYYPRTYRIHAPKAKKMTVIETASKNVRSKTVAVDGIAFKVPAYILVEKDKNGNYTIGNMKIATSYAWQADTGAKGEFRTEDMTPRLLKLKGVPNVRDLGGYIGLNGRRTRQGMIYRTAGLNDNASATYKSVGDRELDADGGKLRKIKNENEQIIRESEAELKNAKNKKISLVPYSLKNEWAVFTPTRKLVPADYAKIAALKKIPAELFGAKASKMTADSNGRMGFPTPNVYMPAIFMQNFTAPEEGVMQIGTGADWFYLVYINGSLHLDLIETGNMTGNINKGNHILNIPVKKGENLIVIPMLSGASSWALYVGKPDRTRSYSHILREKIAVAKENLRRKINRIVDKRTPGKNRLDAETKAYVVKDLGIRSDIDLRSDGECYGMKGSPVGREVSWFHYSSHSYGGMQSVGGKTAFAKVFRVFLDRKNYPVVFHCIAGQDRTGAVAFILNALLGVPEEKLFLDWEVTGFWNSSASFNHKNLFHKLYQGFDRYPGRTIQERVEAYVLSCGFTGNDIEIFRGIMLE